MRKLLIGGITAVVLAIAPSTASATDASKLQETEDTWTSCRAPALLNPFAQFGDDLDYVLSPSGSFEGAATGWGLRKGAAVVPGNDPFELTDGTDERALSLPGGSSATSPLMCVDLNFPTFRFPYAGLDDDAKLKVKVMYPDVPGADWRKVAAIEGGEEGWSITDHLPLYPETGGPESGERRVAMRFQVSGDDDGFMIDDVYVDPRCRN